MNRTASIILTGILVLAAIGLVAFFVTRTNTSNPDNGNGDGTVCAQDARQCADGSYVQRVAPSCNFAECPLLPPVQQSENIKVYSPAPGEALSSPVPIIGEARVFENTLNYRIRDNNGTVIGEGTVTAQSPDVGKFGPFSISATFETPQTEIGKVEVFDFSARDGSVENLVTIPVRFDAQDTMTVQAFFGNTKADPGTLQCEKTYGVFRSIPRTEAVARAAILEMLQGPTAQEKQAGFTTSIQNGAQVKVNSLTIENGVAKIDFSQELEQSAGGSCRVAAARSQITNTLKQFPTVKSVTISINGKSEDILQP